ncbi:MAG: hypothetical protein AB8H47_21720 [Bacteroidia bacterium]
MARIEDWIISTWPSLRLHFVKSETSPRFARSKARSAQRELIPLA